jgi:hypothetical protein
MASLGGLESQFNIFQINSIVFYSKNQIDFIEKLHKEIWKFPLTHTQNNIVGVYPLILKL